MVAATSSMVTGSNLSQPFAAEQLPAMFGRYRLTRVLGVGGMGTVYLADDTVLQRQVALKIPHGNANKATVDRFLEEARAAARINHPNVCAVYDVGIESGHPFLTMEYVPGKSLAEMIDAGSQLQSASAIKIVLSIAAGLHAAHQHGVIHRDLKPANVLMRDSGTPVITDFGLASRHRDSSRQRTARLAGSPSYMSPEQVRCDSTLIGPATDVYGLGTILYELVTGRRVFSGPIPQVYSQVLTRTPPPPAKISTTDDRISNICMRALAKSPGDRFDDVVEFARALKSCLQSASVGKPVPRPSGDRLVMARPNGRTPAQAMYELEARQIHKPIPPCARSWVAAKVQQSRRFRWTLSRQRTGFVSGILLASSVSLIVIGAAFAWLSIAV